MKEPKRMTMEEYRSRLTKPKKRNKYNAKKVTIDGITFHSIKEGNRYIDLKKCKLAIGPDKVIDLQLQPKFPCKVNGKLVCTYIADFRIEYAGGRVVIEDCKGFKTSIYRLKKKFVEALYDIEIIET